MLNLDGNPVGLAGGTALIETFNHHTRHRTIMLHACTYPSDSKAGTGKASDGRYAAARTYVSVRAGDVHYMRVLMYVHVYWY